MRASVLAASAVGILLLAGSPVTRSLPQHLRPSSRRSLRLASYRLTKLRAPCARAGFDPLAPPLREGSTYVVRATDFRGILMRVVVDARSGAIRDVNRIVPGPGSYGQTAGMIPYGPEPDDLPQPYGQPADYGFHRRRLRMGRRTDRSWPRGRRPRTR